MCAVQSVRRLTSADFALPLSLGQGTATTDGSQATSGTISQPFDGWICAVRHWHTRCLLK